MQRAVISFLYYERFVAGSRPGAGGGTAGTNSAAANLAGFWQEESQTGKVGFSDNVNEILLTLTYDHPPVTFFWWSSRAESGCEGRVLK